MSGENVFDNIASFLIAAESSITVRDALWIYRDNASAFRVRGDLSFINSTVSFLNQTDRALHLNGLDGEIFKAVFDGDISFLNNSALYDGAGIYASIRSPNVSLLFRGRIIFNNNIAGSAGGLGKLKVKLGCSHQHSVAEW